MPNRWVSSTCDLGAPTYSTPHARRRASTSPSAAASTAAPAHRWPARKPGSRLSACWITRPTSGSLRTTTAPRITAATSTFRSTSCADSRSCTWNSTSLTVRREGQRRRGSVPRPWHVPDAVPRRVHPPVGSSASPKLFRHDRRRDFGDPAQHHCHPGAPTASALSAGPDDHRVAPGCQDPPRPFEKRTLRPVALHCVQNRYD